MARVLGEFPVNSCLEAGNNMTYKLDGNKLLLAIPRAEILDISVKDVITVEGFDGARYVWTDHDSDFLENNPDADIFLEIERTNADAYRATGILLK
jgi:hypothetical protein